MTKRLTPFFVGLSVILAAGSTLFQPVASAVRRGDAQESKPAPLAKGLTAQERRGKAIYLRGESPSGREVRASVAGIAVPASTVTCAGCHGLRGEGQTEGGVTAGNITWVNLLSPSGHTHPNGRRHGPFDESSFLRALSSGKDPAGNTLHSAMPRYKMAAEDAADLIAYLKRIGDERDPGLTETSVKVGVLLPPKGALAETGAAMRDVLAAYFADLNEKGGIHGRRVELQSAVGGDTPAATAAAARRFAEEAQVFALVGGISAGADEELATVNRELELPLVGPATLMPYGGANRHVFYLTPGIAEQARSLVNFHSRQQPQSRPTRVAVVYASGGIGASAAAAVEERCAQVGCGPIQKASYERGKLEVRALLENLKGVETVFFFGGGDEAEFLKEADATGWRPKVYLIGVLTGSGLAGAVPAGFRESVYVAFPTVPTDLTPAGVAEFRALLEKHNVTARHMSAQFTALGAAKVFAEALRRAGRDLSRERLINALEGLYEFETGFTPRITYGPNRRVGAAGASVLKVDPEKKEFVAAGGWVNAF